MYSIELSKHYRKSYAKIARSGKFPRDEIDFIVDKISRGEKLDSKYKDHVLKGELAGIRECHVRPDLLLLYQIEGDVLVLLLVDIGSHAELFG